MNKVTITIYGVQGTTISTFNLRKDEAQHEAGAILAMTGDIEPLVSAQALIESVYEGGLHTINDAIGRKLASFTEALEH